ncbi:hypothetical protein N8H74_19280 [Pseudomonas sp. B2M1-30]|uniref:hypothetical protein n=1 Tax=Pseudomonas TaxID=286 RepID=UPI0021C93DCF|nr:hypothetical protein [Pseudomonas sp. B2M1-30]MCU7262431.1 hypothetical protein [Pseudomonas koreensis]
MTVKSGLVFCAVLLAGQASADCTPMPVKGDQDYSVCKEWPAYEGLTLSAYAHLNPAVADAFGTYDLDVSVLSEGHSAPIAAYHQAAAYTLEGVGLQELALDTARYKLAPDLRAFGVRARLNNASRLNPVEENQLSLYVREGAKLRSVLSKLLVYQYGGEWDGNCAGERFEITRTVEIAKTNSHAYADLIVKTQQTHTTSVGEGDACEDKTIVDKPVLTTLRYDGDSYAVPIEFKGL